MEFNDRGPETSSSDGIGSAVDPKMVLYQQWYVSGRSGELSDVSWLDISRTKGQNTGSVDCSYLVLVPSHSQNGIVSL